MKPEDRRRFPPQAVGLKDGRQGVIRPLATDDAVALGDFYATVPREDLRFYCPHPLTREKAAENAAAADSPYQVVLVLEAPDRTIAGYAWYRWTEENASRSTLGICIRRDFQGVGAGQALLARLLEIAQEIGPPIVSLTVQLANARGRALYQKMGFRVVREQVRPADPALGLEAEPEYYMERRVRGE